MAHATQERDGATQAVIDELVGAAHGDLARVQKILTQRPDLVNAAARWGETPIQAAAQMASTAIVEYLLGAGAPLDICTASMLGLGDTVKVFLADDAGQTKAAGAHGIPVMYFAVITGQMHIAQILRRAGASVSGGAGVATPLHGAVMFNQVEVVPWLVKNGANIDARDFNGKTPLELAEEKGLAEIAAILRSRGKRK